MRKKILIYICNFCDRRESHLTENADNATRHLLGFEQDQCIVCGGNDSRIAIATIDS